MGKVGESDRVGMRNRGSAWGAVRGMYGTRFARSFFKQKTAYEIYIPSDVPTSERVWNEVMEAGRDFGIIPCGLGARNTLRLESKMALYGHEISDTINVWEADLGRYAKMEKRDFVGRA